MEIDSAGEMTDLLNLEGKVAFVTGASAGLGAHFAGVLARAGAEVIKAKVPLSEMFGYVTQLRSLSSGRASSTMEFSHYAPAPNNIAEEVIAKSKGKVNAG